MQHHGRLPDPNPNPNPKPKPNPEPKPKPNPKPKRKPKPKPKPKPNPNPKPNQADCPTSGACTSHPVCLAHANHNSTRYCVEQVVLEEWEYG